MTGGIDLERRGALALITLNKPEANSLDIAFAEGLYAAATEVDEDASVRAVLLQAKGRLFCAGGDLKYFADEGTRIGIALKKLAMTLHAAVSRFARMDKPLVIAVQGPAAGAGLSLAVAGDIVVAARSAHFTMAYTAAGLVPDGSSTWTLPRLIGVRRTQELMLTNRRLTADEALAWGLITEVVDDDQLSAHALGVAEKLSAGPTRAFGATKRLLLESSSGSLETQMERETRAIAEIGQTADGQAGIHAFLERRKPTFTGR